MFLQKLRSGYGLFTVFDLRRGIFMIFYPRNRAISGKNTKNVTETGQKESVNNR